MCISVPSLLWMSHWCYCSQVDWSSNVYTGNDVCPAGYYCPNGTSYPFSCPLGTFSVNEGLTASTECEPCPAGRWCNVTAYRGGNSAPLCDPGCVHVLQRLSDGTVAFDIKSLAAFVASNFVHYCIICHILVHNKELVCKTRQSPNI